MKLMKRFTYILILFVLFLLTGSLHAQNRMPYPVIFVHGLAGGETTFGGTLEYLRDEQSMGPINVFDMVLNADNNSETAMMSEDVRWEDFVYDGDSIYLGRRNYDVSFDEYTHSWEGHNLFAVNFKEEKILGAHGTFNDHFDQSNQAAIFKQGFALSKMIAEVLEYSGAEKVILAGHSMGGLAIREYLQRTDGQGTHINWQDPWSPDGHKVARVVTFGTPHLGSNTSPDPTKSNTPSATGNSEANRDLLWEYDSYNFCEDSAVYKGIYMFGGYEHCIESESGIFGNSTFDNVDINCDGDHNDYINGINESYYSYRDNPDMPLPQNIRYTWLTSIWADWASSLTGDGAVDIERQWLHENGQPVPEGLADTCLSNVFHTSEGGDYATFMRGLDEPGQFSLAYFISPGDSINGYITYGQNYNPVDRDMFLIPSAMEDAIDIIVDNPQNQIDSIYIFDVLQNEISSQNINTPYDSLHIEFPGLNTDSVYLCVKGTATNSNWQTPYQLTVKPSLITGLANTKNKTFASIYPNPAKDVLSVIIPGDTKTYFRIFTPEGLKIMSDILPDNGQISLGKINRGLYFITFKTGNKMETHKLIISD